MTPISKYLLLAEDCDFIAQMLYLGLQQVLPSHFQTIRVRDGDQALLAIQQKPFCGMTLDEKHEWIQKSGLMVDIWEVAVLDCNMPISSGKPQNAGIEVAKKIKQLQQKVFVISCSSENREEFTDPNLYDRCIPKVNNLRILQTIFEQQFPKEFQSMVNSKL